MNRTKRTMLAQETVEIINRRSYAAPSGRTVDLRGDIAACLAATQLLGPEALAEIRHQVLAQPPAFTATAVEVANETSLAGLARLLADCPEPVAVLNFASARNPGGGFLHGSEAQEESLARSSALYASLLQAEAYYDTHRNLPSLLYTHTMIASPGCPVFRDDAGALLETPRQATFITSAAPNAGALAHLQPADLPQVPEVLHQRAEYVLALAAHLGHRRLVLGAWGCGVFRNDPRLVADSFMRHLRGAWQGRFERIVFSVLDRSEGQPTFSAFQAATA